MAKCAQPVYLSDSGRSVEAKSCPKRTHGRAYIPVAGDLNCKSGIILPFGSWFQPAYRTECSAFGAKYARVSLYLKAERAGTSASGTQLWATCKSAPQRVRWSTFTWSQRSPAMCCVSYWKYTHINSQTLNSLIPQTSNNATDHNLYDALQISLINSNFRVNAHQGVK